MYHFEEYFVFIFVSVIHFPTYTVLFAFINFDRKPGISMFTGVIIGRKLGIVVTENSLGQTY